VREFLVFLSFFLSFFFFFLFFFVFVFVFVFRGLCLLFESYSCLVSTALKGVLLCNVMKWSDSPNLFYSIYLKLLRALILL